MSFDPEVANSNGYFKDPVTKQDLTGNEERVVKCSIEDSGKLIWPQVKFSDGSVGKIVYKLWTAEEKAIYKQYRELGKQHVKPSKPAIVPQTQQPVKQPEVTHPQVMFKECSGSVASGNTLAYIRNCNQHLGVWIYEDVVYDNISVEGSNSYMPVARSLIPHEDRVRLGITA